jgi:hypothetical protein
MKHFDTTQRNALSIDGQLCDLLLERRLLLGMATAHWGLSREDPASIGVVYVSLIDITEKRQKQSMVRSIHCAHVVHVLRGMHPPGTQRMAKDVFWAFECFVEAPQSVLGWVEWVVVVAHHVDDAPCGYTLGQQLITIPV